MPGQAGDIMGLTGSRRAEHWLPWWGGRERMQEDGALGPLLDTVHCPPHTGPILQKRKLRIGIPHSVYSLDHSTGPRRWPLQQGGGGEGDAYKCLDLLTRALAWALVHFVGTNTMGPRNADLTLSLWGSRCPTWTKGEASRVCSALCWPACAP